MNFDSMLSYVAIGKVAYLGTRPDVLILREGDCIIRKTYHKNAIKMIFVATNEEMNSRDWRIVEDDQEEEFLTADHLHQKIDNFKITPSVMWGLN